MNTCDTCKWWGANNPSDTTGRRVCSYAAFSIWSQDRLKPDGAHCEGEHKGNPVIVAFVSGPKFGCIHHESK